MAEGVWPVASKRVFFVRALTLGALIAAAGALLPVFINTRRSRDSSIHDGSTSYKTSFLFMCIHVHLVIMYVEDQYMYQVSLRLVLTFFPLAI